MKLIAEDYKEIPLHLSQNTFYFMIKLNDLWIGDLLLIRSTGEVGKYEGDAHGKAKVSIKGKISIIAPNDLQVFEGSEAIEHLHLDLEKDKPIEVAKVESEIDLHIEKLAPHMLNQSLSRILDFQIEKAENYVKKAIIARKIKVLIIHGKGTGTLKAEVQHMLRGIDKVRFLFDKNDGGATEVWLDI